ncbi:MAG: SGNH/GDSL hydrolase family protein [Deltaproteobacteria bacterium]|nr:SGNH/GDSL hydrolase family protein [Deltaproteobacteria bacterium]
MKIVLGPRGKKILFILSLILVCVGLSLFIVCRYISCSPLLLVVFFTATVVAVLLLTEAYLRYCTSLDITTYNTRKVKRKYIINGVPTAFLSRCISDENLDMKLKPNYSEQHQDLNWKFNFFFKTNSDGFRQSADIPTLVNQFQHKPKIMVLGDSVTFGWGVDQNNTFTAQLNKSFNNDAHFFNMSVGGWSFAEYFITYNKYKKNISPDLVMVATSPGDFAELNFSSWKNKNTGQLPLAVKRKDYCITREGYFRYDLIAEKYPILRNSYLWILLCKKGLQRIYDMLRSDSLDSYAIAADIVKKISEETPVLVVMLPADYSYKNGTYDTTPSNLFLSRLKEEKNIHVLDCYPTVFENDLYKNFFLDGTHYTRESNLFIAEKISDYIKSSSLLQRHS